jgi:hypothetical protein
VSKIANKIKIILALAVGILVPVAATFLLAAVFRDLELKSEALRILVGIAYMAGFYLWITYTVELVRKWNDRE